MKRIYGLTATLVVAAAAMTATVDDAEAGRRHRGGLAVGAIIGGLALGATLGNHRAYGYGYRPYYSNSYSGDYYYPGYRRHNYYSYRRHHQHQHHHRWNHW